MLDPEGVALVVEHGEDGGKRPLKFVMLHAEDLGTRLQPTNVVGVDLPNPEDAYAEIRARNQTPDN